MAWPSIREFLRVPESLTGKAVRIALVDGEFTAHPDVASSPTRAVYQIKLAEEDPRPEPMGATWEPWPDGAHGLWAAAAAAGSGLESGGRYQGMAPEAELYLVKSYVPGKEQTIQEQYEHALCWLAEHWREYGIRGVQASIKGANDSGLLPWQTDPLRVLCEQLSSEGLLVVSGTGNHTDCTSWVTQGAAPSTLSLGGVIIPPDGTPESAAPYHGCRGTTFEGKWVPEVLAPAENLVLPWVPGEYLDSHYSAGTDALPHGYARTEGSSFAGPIVLGAAACVWQAHPEWSASQVKEALKRTCVWLPQWGELQAGLIDVRAAAELSDPLANVAPSPYEQYQCWRGRPLLKRLALARSAEDAESVEALLSFLPGTVPDECVETAAGLLAHPSPRRRAAALCVLATRPEYLAPHHVLPQLSDANPYVRMAALHAVRRSDHLWETVLPQVERLLRDPSPDICYSASEVAAQIGRPELVGPLVAALEEDARLGRTYLWGARVQGLQCIIGQAFPQEPEWRHGECHYTERRRRARAGVTERWREWLSAQGGSQCG